MAMLTKQRLFSILGIMVGLLSIMAGSKVLLGISSPGDVVLRWLVVYNVLLGVASVVAGTGLWNLRSWAISLAGLIAVSHGFVLILLIAFMMFGEAVAHQSIIAMFFRTTAWVGICFAGRTLRTRLQAKGKEQETQPG